MNANAMHEEARLDKAAYLDAIRTETNACADAALAAGPDARVPGCPDWDVAELVHHLSGVQGFWATVVRGRHATPPEFAEPERLAFAEAVARLRDAAADLVAALEGADPAEEVWTWSDDHHVGWVIRHQAEEAVVHRRDAEDAAGAGTPIPTELAADGVDEFLYYMATEPAEGAPRLGGPVHLHATDTAGEWLATEDDAGFLAVERAHGKGAAALRGTASDLLLVLYRRLPLDALEILGDADVAARFLTRIDAD